MMICPKLAKEIEQYYSMLGNALGIYCNSDLDLLGGKIWK